MAETDPKPELLQEEREYRQSALEGFLAARQSESFPICGMDELTVDYLIAVLSMEFEHYDMRQSFCPAFWYHRLQIRGLKTEPEI